MLLFTQTRPTKPKWPKQHRSQKETTQSFNRQRQGKHIANVAGKIRTPRAKLTQQHQATGQSQAKVDAKQPRPETAGV